MRWTGCYLRGARLRAEAARAALPREGSGESRGELILTSSSSHERRSPLSATSRYYPGFWGALFLVLLRVAIGWHFMTEGMAKVDPKDGKPFNSEGYFRVANGPLAPYFRGMIPDGNGVERLRRDQQGLPVGLKEQWAVELEPYANHYGFTNEQRTSAEAALAEMSAVADDWFHGPENKWRVRKYMTDLRKVILTEKNPDALESEKELAYKARPKLNTERKELLAVLDGWTDSLHEKWTNIATAEQREAAGAYEAPWSRFDWMNWLTKWGLVVSGACLILGLLTPVAALWAAGFLALIYLSVPPWPGLPPSPIAEGNYWIVNKNLVEMLACLVLAATPSGLWVGLDALLFGWIGRRKAEREVLTEGYGSDDGGSDNGGRQRGRDPRRPGTVTRS